jgi:hypothetical protein
MEMIRHQSVQNLYATLYLIQEIESIESLEDVIHKLNKIFSGINIEDMEDLEESISETFLKILQDNIILILQMVKDLNPEKEIVKQFLVNFKDLVKDYKNLIKQTFSKNKDDFFLNKYLLQTEKTLYRNKRILLTYLLEDPKNLKEVLKIQEILDKFKENIEFIKYISTKRNSNEG